MRRWCETAFSFNPLKHNKTMKELLTKQWCVACKDYATDTPELLEWRNFGWTGSGFITNEKGWINDNEGFYNVRPIISYETFLELVYNPWKGIHPQSWKWCIEMTKENKDILFPWWKENAVDWAGCCPILEGYTLLSTHPSDTSMYYCNDLDGFLDSHPEYKAITLEQFKTITSKTKPVMDTNKVIQISRTLLNEYYNAATTPQKEFINGHFTIDGTTKVEYIIGLHNLACDEWKSIIKANHPDCFPATKTNIELAVEKAGSPDYDMSRVTIQDDLILVKLPTANGDWSFAAFKWVMKFCEENPRCYPVHRSSNNNNDYLYIQWEY